MRDDPPLLSALLPQKFNPNIQPSDLNPTPLPQILSLIIQQDVPPFKPLSACAPPPLLYVSLQGRGEPPILPSTLSAYVPMLPALLLRKGVPLFHPSSKPSPLPQISAVSLQQGMPNLQPLAMRATPPPPLSVSLQGLGVPTIIP